MNVRGKLFSAMAVLVFFMGIAYFMSTQIYMRKNIPPLVSAAVHEKTRPWIDTFQTYYVKHGRSWSGIDRTFQPFDSDPTHSAKSEQIALFSPDGKLIYKTGDGVSESEIGQGLKEPIKVNGQTVGFLMFFDQEIIHIIALQQSIFHEMVHVSIKVVAGLSVIALVIGFWLSRKLTSPLHRLSFAIERIAKGDLSIKLDVTSSDEYGKVTAALNRMTVELSHSEEARKHLIADVAHELRTPLTILQGQFELLQQNGEAIAPVMLLPMVDEVIRLNRLVNDLLQLSLAEGGKLPMEKQTTDLLMLLNRLKELLGFEAEEKNVQLILTSSVKNVNLFVDPHRMTQVFYNLITNAIRYTPMGGQVSIVLSEKFGTNESDIVISIADTGPGIPAEHLPYLFERFYRAENDRSRYSGGMGLGLAIAKQLVELHGGQIEVASRVGSGTVFTVFLPSQKHLAAAF
ncbi:MAG: sensory transduction histidine kinase [Bacilli bacterium]|nr:sensory transduction histidine kinase [Bacilli bacterium]